MLMVTTRANLSPVFGLYPDPNCEADTLLDAAVAGKTPLVAYRSLGRDPSDVAGHRRFGHLEAFGRHGAKPLFIADGHHRYETACNYRDQIYD